MTEKKLSQITSADYLHRVSFRRPASAISTRPVISGRLLSTSATQNHLGQARYSILLEHPSRYGISNHDSFENLPSDFPISVGSLWRDKRNPWDMPDDEQPRLIAHLHGGPLDGRKIRLDAERWDKQGIVREGEDGQLNVYEPKKIPDGLGRPVTRHERSWGYVGWVYDGTIHMRFRAKETEDLRASDAAQRWVRDQETRRQLLDKDG